MNKRVQKKTLSLLVILDLIMQTLLALAIAQPAAAITWPLGTSDIYPHQVYTHGDGSVTLAECPGSFASYSTKTLKTITPAGTVTNNLSKSSSDMQATGCESSATAGADGTFYAKFSKYNSQGYRDIQLAAFKNNAKLWSTSVQICSSGQKDGDPRWVTVGHDGDIYAVVAGYCAAPDKLVGFSAADGSLKFEVSLNSDSYNEPSYWPRVAVYSSGLAVFDGTTLRYFNYDGTAGTPTDYSFPLASGEYIRGVSYGANGRVSVTVSKTGQTGCNAKTLYLAYHDLNGNSGSINTLGQCINMSVVRAMPDGGVLLQEMGDYPRVVRYSSSGNVLYEKSLWSMSGYNYVWVAWVQPDANGNVVVVRSAQEWTSGSGFDRHTFVDVIDTLGNMQRVFDTTAYDTTVDNEVFNYTQGERLGLAENTLYLPICKTPCSASNPVHLHKISVTGLGMDYPRSQVMAAQPAQLNYVALGDSFSSGEGVEPFINGTDTAGPPENRCHRSEKAYPMLLDKDPTLSLNLQAFRACSGATTQQVVEGRSGEAGQLDSLNEDTDVVTITVGGNDIGFEAFARQCFMPSTIGCTAASDEYQFAHNVIDSGSLYESLADEEGVYTLIASQAPNAQVYVLGYPQIVPVSTGPDAPAYCAYLSETEKVAVRDLVVKLNNVIKDAADDVGSNFHYVDPEALTSPFINKEICKEGAYFNGATAPPNEGYSYHPNTLGQQAYYALVKENM